MSINDGTNKLFSLCLRTASYQVSLPCKKQPFMRVPLVEEKGFIIRRIINTKGRMILRLASALSMDLMASVLISALS
ncbi:MAG: hypothetical protein QUS08_10450, partial [Methanothrix sp.]|nr:hypothetical protein [Methanothrix sp.]